jgi:hypothetical protein
VGITLNELTDEVIINLAGYTLQQDRATHLRTDLAATASTVDAPLTISLGSSESVGKGTVEIDDELIWIDAIDRVGNTATIAPYGRGYLGTTAATHTKGTKVTISPTFPRFVIKRAIQDTIKALGSVIYAVKQTSFTFNPAVTTYELDNLNIQNILSMHWQEIGATKEWIRIRRYDFDSNPETATWGATAQTVTIGDLVAPGRTVKVTYGTAPVELSTTLTTSYSAQTGLPESTRDVVILGACYRLLAYLDPARAAQTSPQADETDNKRPFGSSQNATKQLYALYSQRLAEEKSSQQKQYPPRVHFSR